MIAPRTITDDLEALLDVLPIRIAVPLRQRKESSDFLEVVMDLGRKPMGRFTTGEVSLSEQEVTDDDINYVVTRVGDFGEDNRAGIERTLHRISCIRNRRGRIVGLTCRVGRAVYGTIKIIDDLVQSGKSILLLGRPGVGKTTMLREIARVLSSDLGKRVVVVDTSNEIAGDGDIPHAAIGAARRMQVATPAHQHAVMIEAVENHMPEVIIIDEIGTELEATASRTIAERGVQLVGTAHGNTLENLMMNPTLSDLVGGIQSVTLSDEEARRRGSQKSVLERKAPPTFDIVVEIQAFDRVAVHEDVSGTVDALLRGRAVNAAVRQMVEGGGVSVTETLVESPVAAEHEPPTPFRMNDRMGDRMNERSPRAIMRPEAVKFEKFDTALPSDDKLVDAPPIKLFSFGVSKTRVQDVIAQTRLPITLTESLDDASAVLTSRSYYRRRAQPIRDAEASGVPIYVLKNHTTAQLQQGIFSISQAATGSSHTMQAIKEAEDASYHIMNSGEQIVELEPRNAYLRRLQHQVAQRYNLPSRSTGREPWRRVQIYHDAALPAAESD